MQYPDCLDDIEAPVERPQLENIGLCVLDVRCSLNAALPSRVSEAGTADVNGENSRSRKSVCTNRSGCEPVPQPAISISHTCCGSRPSFRLDVQPLPQVVHHRRSPNLAGWWSQRGWGFSSYWRCTSSDVGLSTDVRAGMFAASDFSSKGWRICCFNSRLISSGHWRLSSACDHRQLMQRLIACARDKVERRQPRVRWSAHRKSAPAPVAVGFVRGHSARRRIR